MIGERGKALVVTAAVLAYAVLSVGSGLDRHSSSQPSLVRLVPKFLRADSEQVLAATALTNGRLDEARTRAMMGVRRDPYDPRGPAYLGAVQDLAGQGEQAARSFTYASALSWRDPLTQSYWFARKWREGDAEGAAVRLDALLRVHPEFAPAQDFLGKMEGDRRGRVALMGRLLGTSHWSTAYLSATGIDDKSLRRRARFVADSGGARLGCTPVLPMVHKLMAQGYRADADALLAAQCPSALARTVVADPHFQQLADEQVVALGWERHGSGDTLISPLAGRFGGVELRNRGGVTRLLLSQSVAPAPGRRIVRGSVSKGDAQRLLVSLDCGAPMRPQYRSDARVDKGIPVVVANCPNQTIGLWLRPGASELTLKEIQLLPDR